RPASADRLGRAVVRETVETIILLLAPIVPHITQELWNLLGRTEELANVAWPVFDPTVASEEVITIVIQINGKVRSRIEVPADEEAEQITALALADEKIARQIAGKTVVKQVYVPKKLVNIVVRD
ncbi:MAG: class I tRNA ligase family protein, partial [Thermodesulfobacteriota bacterium]